MNAGHLVETFKFWDIVTQWSRETVQGEEIIARAMARGIIIDGLRCQSTDPRWMKTDGSLTGSPFVGYAALPDQLPIVLRLDALDHLIAIVRKGEAPSRDVLAKEFVHREDFARWIDATGQARPAFWFSQTKQAVAA